MRLASAVVTVHPSLISAPPPHWAAVFAQLQIHCEPAHLDLAEGARPVWPRPTVVILPSASLAREAAGLWRAHCAATWRGLAPQFDTLLGWAQRLGRPVDAGQQALFSFDAGAQSAEALYRVQGVLGEAGTANDASEADTFNKSATVSPTALSSLLLQTVQAVVHAAQAVPPVHRGAWAADLAQRLGLGALSTAIPSKKAVFQTAPNKSKGSDGKSRPSPENTSSLPPSVFHIYETLCQNLALEWLGAAHFATDVLFELPPSTAAEVVWLDVLPPLGGALTAASKVTTEASYSGRHAAEIDDSLISPALGQPRADVIDPLQTALQSHWGGQPTVLSLFTNGAATEAAPTAEPDPALHPVSHPVLRFANRQAQAQHTAAALLHTLADAQARGVQSVRSVAWVALDRTATRQAQVMLEAQAAMDNAPVITWHDETGWALATTRAAGLVLQSWVAVDLALELASDHAQPTTDALLAWLKDVAYTSAHPVVTPPALQTLEAALRRAGIGQARAALAFLAHSLQSIERRERRERGGTATAPAYAPLLAWLQALASPADKRRPHTLAAWLHRMVQLWADTGVLPRLLADAAGQQVLTAVGLDLYGLQTVFAPDGDEYKAVGEVDKEECIEGQPQNTAVLKPQAFAAQALKVELAVWQDLPLTAATFKAWLAGCLERQRFVVPVAEPSNAPPRLQVHLVPLSQVLGRSFDAVWLLGCDAQHLPALPASAGGASRCWSPSQRTALGLPSDAALAEAQWRTLHTLWHTTPAGRLQASWAAQLDGKPAQLSPVLARLTLPPVLTTTASQIAGETASSELNPLRSAPTAASSATLNAALSASLSATLSAYCPLPQPTQPPAPSTLDPSPSWGVNDFGLQTANIQTTSSATPGAPITPLFSLPPTVSASSYAALQNCPYQYFSRKVLGLKRWEEFADGASRQDFGQWLHRTLHLTHQNLPPSPAHAAERGSEAGTESALNRWLELLAQQLERSGEQARLDLALDAAAFLPYHVLWRKLRPQYLAWCKSHHGGYSAAQETHQWHSGERYLKVPLAQSDLAEQAAEHADIHVNSWQLEGFIDRIDQIHPIRPSSPAHQQPEATLHVIDYKTESRRKTEQKHKDGSDDVQLAFYAALLLLDNPKLSVDALRASYLSFDDKGGVQLLTQKDLAQRVDALLRALPERLQNHAAGQPLAPTGEDAHCQYCEAQGLCRKAAWHTHTELRV